MSAMLPSDASIILTYRCQMRCKMCSIWENPTDHRREITADVIDKLPKLKVINITGGEPFVRKDIEEFVIKSLEKADNVVISTSGWHVDRILDICSRHPRLGIRVSIEGLSQNNDNLRGRAGGFDRALRLLIELERRGHKNIGFGITVSNNNSKDLMPLHQFAGKFGMELSTATFHNSFYFHKSDNEIKNQDEVISQFVRLANSQLASNSPKEWFRALYNLGLVRYIKNNKRMLPCEAGSTNFFIYPYGEIYPCNGLEEKYWLKSMGNIHDYSTFEDLWHSEKAESVRKLVATCPKNCWMVGTGAPVIKKYIAKTGPWVLRNKLKSVFGIELTENDSDDAYFDVGQDKRQGDLRDEQGPVEVIDDGVTIPSKGKIEFKGDFEEDNLLVKNS